jgi:hypothetical protein
MIKIAALLTIILYQAAIPHASFAGDPHPPFKNSLYGFSVSFPEGWTLFEKRGGSPRVGARNDSGDRITVTVDTLSSGHAGKYRDIFEIPGYLDYTLDSIRKGLGGRILDSGTMVISGRPGQWLRFILAPGSASPDKFTVVYQVQTLWKDSIYSITARLAAPDSTRAIRRFHKLWPALEKTIQSFHLEGATTP